MTLTDKSGVPVTVHKGTGRFTVAVDGRSVGLVAFADRDEQRVFFHTEVDDAFGGRGLASVLIGEALARTKAEGMRIVPVCPMVIAYVKKHPQDGDVVDRPTQEILALAAAAVAANRAEHAPPLELVAPPQPDPRAPTPAR